MGIGTGWSFRGHESVFASGGLIQLVRVLAQFANRCFFSFEFRGQAKIVTCSPDAHLHFLSNSNPEITLCVFRRGLPPFSVSKAWMNL